MFFVGVFFKYSIVFSCNFNIVLTLEISLRDGNNKFKLNSKYMKRKLLFKKVRIFFSLFLLLSVFVTSAQTQKTVTGIVLSSENDELLPGATILEKGTTNGTSTDFDGKFSFNVSS
ncbi:MAG: hypothetical protein GQ552_01355, partial [Flavobacteriaceae bacterium]|nr:hypothetical protein [Flavobacteriaceae bacterium]